MPEEIESPVEKLNEALHERAQHAKEAWLKWSALLSALLAVMAATAGLESAHNANDAMITQIQASDQWGYYQAKGIKLLVANSEKNILKQLNKSPSEDDYRYDKYREDQEASKAEAMRLTEVSKRHLEKHEVFSYTVTLSQIAIAIVAIAVLTRRRPFVLVSLGFGVIGLIFLIKALLMV